MTILVTGARGQIGRAVIERLHTAGVAVRAATTEPSALELPAAVDRVEWRDDPETLTAAMKDVREVFLYANPATVDAVLAAATRAGVEHAVLLSSSAAGHPGAAENSIGSRHLVVENALAASSLTVTALRPGGLREQLVLLDPGRRRRAADRTSLPRGEPDPDPSTRYRRRRRLRTHGR